MKEWNQNEKSQNEKSQDEDPRVVAARGLASQVPAGKIMELEPHEIETLRGDGGAPWSFDDTLYILERVFEDAAPMIVVKRRGEVCTVHREVFTVQR
jgi:hypothetical protein